MSISFGRVEPSERLLVWYQIDGRRHFGTERERSKKRATGFFNFTSVEAGKVDTDDHPFSDNFRRDEK